jgi:hypothetical protein
MHDFMWVNRPHLPRFNRNHIKRLPIKRKKFHFVGIAGTINMNNRANVSSHQSVLRQINGQDGSFVFL